MNIFGCFIENEMLLEIKLNAYLKSEKTLISKNSHKSHTAVLAVMKP
jgi:hypothetical protein